MAKLKQHKPTPAQARVLKAMDEHELGVYLGRGVEWTGGSWWKVEQEHGKPRKSSIKRMIEQGWLEAEKEGSSRYFISDRGRLALSRLSEYDFISRGKLGLNANDIIEALRKRHTLPEWVFVEEVRLATGYGTRATASGYSYRVDQRIDALALNAYPSKGFQVVAYEVKISKSDFMHEIEDPLKRLPAISLSNYFYFATPAHLVQPIEVPEDCGLLEVFHGAKTKIKVQAPRTESDPPDWSLVCSIGRSLQRRPGG